MRQYVGATAQGTAAQATAELARVHARVQTAVAARIADRAQATVHRTAPVGHEIAGIEPRKPHVGLPAQRRRPPHLSATVETTGRHRRAQRVDLRGLVVAARLHADARALGTAQQRGVALRGPVAQTAGKLEIAVADDRYRVLGIALPAQFARAHRAGETRIGRVVEIGAAGRGHGAAQHFDRQRRQQQDLFLDRDRRRQHSRGEVALRDAALQIRFAANPVGAQIEGVRFGLVVGAQQRGQCHRRAVRFETPARLRFALYTQARFHRRRRAAGKRDFERTQVAARNQAQRCRRAPGSGRQHRAGGEIHAVAIARHVLAVRGETAAVAGRDDAGQLQAAVLGHQPAAHTAQADDRFGLRRGRAHHVQIINPDIVGFQSQRRRDRGQRVRPARQLEGLVGVGQQQCRAGDAQRFQAQTTAEQRLQHGVEHRPLRSERGDQRGLAIGPCHRFAVLVRTAAMHVAQVVQDHRPRGRTLGARPRQLAARGQAADDLVQQHVAAAQGVEQEIQQQRAQRSQNHHQHHTARGQPAGARDAAGAQFSDPHVAFVFGQCAFAHALQIRAKIDVQGE